MPFTTAEEFFLVSFLRYKNVLNPNVDDASLQLLNVLRFWIKKSLLGKKVNLVHYTGFDKQHHATVWQFVIRGKSAVFFQSEFNVFKEVQRTFRMVLVYFDLLMPILVDGTVQCKASLHINEIKNRFGLKHLFLVFS